MTALPDWLPAEAWAGFVAMRKKQRKPMTDKAVERMIARLDTMRAEGHDIAACLNQSEDNCWSDVYPVKERNTQRAQSVKLSPLSKTGQATANNLLAWLEEA